MSEKSRAVFALITCVFFWGISFVSTKIAGVVFPPMSLGALRFALALVFLVFIKNRVIPGEKLTIQDLPLLIGAGLTGVTLYFFFENTGLGLISASEASIIIASIPALTLGAEWLEGKLPRPGKGGGEPARIPGRRWLGALISMIGVVLTAQGAPLPGSEPLLSGAAAGGKAEGTILGYFCMAGAALSWVAYCFLTRPLFSRRSRLYIVYWQTFFGFLAFIPFAAGEFSRWGRPDPGIILHVVFLGLCCSALAYWFYAQSLSVLGIPVSALFLNFVPVITVIAGFLILGERLSPIQWAGAALVLAGVYLATYKGS
ncbi:MAG: DMT family transporter [Spirochaetaceae bacterium]|jgi:drug/metabolite transporter (DMT)-like permease|nr:DMT family transporter [Spirochaetaceae bacterium]